MPLFYLHLCNGQGFVEDEEGADYATIAAARAAGQTILVIDKYIERLVELADRHTIIERGRVAWQGTSAALEADRNLWHRYLGV